MLVVMRSTWSLVSGAHDRWSEYCMLLGLSSTCSLVWVARAHYHEEHMLIDLRRTCSLSWGTHAHWPEENLLIGLRSTHSLAWWTFAHWPEQNMFIGLSSTCTLAYGSYFQWRQSSLKSGGHGSFPGKFPKISIFSSNFTQKIWFFQANFRKISNFFRQLKFFSDFPGKSLSFTATSGQIILFLFKSHHFQTYFLYMISYNNISRPVHDPHNPLRPHDPPAQNLGVAQGIICWGGWGVRPTLLYCSTLC